ncbi:beta-galactosidase [Eisenbergiella tayi]|uniref:Beta-galactosidase n=1 Tax=Eisenbergiella tayi TaxID=1432052 RepID=A0A1E3ALR5_9FIRM|nr:beta-galactosidase [Eisenbergiella tayi]ODM09381.1 Beta-galactosidase BgaP [Eisenbergiella tayi]OIZ62839.1 beta-galactosidase [Eisenbergiella tayi]
MVKKMLYGGDYNPEQWDEAVWEEDMRMFRLAGIDCVTLNVFSWAALQSDEVTYHFERLDKIMELVRKNNLKVVMATSTAAHPAWMAKKYPEVLRTEFNGMKRKFGSRHNSCPNSPVYQKYSVALARKLAERYGTYDNIVTWHISNEYGGECYCENCEKAFRVWLKEKYGSIEALNKAWNTSFWGHTFYDWDEIVVPNLQSEHFAQDRTTFQGISLDYRRFNSDSILQNYLREYEAVKAVTPHIPVTTNLMGFYKALDYQKWAGYMDVVSWDNYPDPTDPPALVAMRHDLMRGLKQGAPFMLMEQTPSVTNWQSYNLLKRPGDMRLISYQAVAHGADTVMFFQMRRSIGACEKFHGAVIDHVGTENTRVFREVSQLGEELKQLGDTTLDSRTPSKAAMLVDWDNWWALEYSAGPSCDLKYMDELANYYTALYDNNISVDIISAQDPLDDYKVVIAPVMYMTKPGADEKIRKFVSEGGTFVTTFLSGLVDEHDLVITGGYPGKLRDILGIWVEETDALPSYMKNSFSWNGKDYDCGLICDIMHMENAQALACYDKDFYEGTPVLSKNEFGKGHAYYVATRAGQDFYADFLNKVLEEQGVEPVFKPCKGVEITIRRKEETNFLFFLNHNPQETVLIAEKPGTDLLTGKEYRPGDEIVLQTKGVVLFKEQNA